jgi:hypothetical protein
MTNRAFRETREQVAQSIRGTLARESRGFEVRLAYVRVAALAAVLCLNTASIRWPWLQGLDRLPPINALTDAAMLTVAVAILFLLQRGWYPPGITALLPAVDATFVFCAYGTVLATAEPALFGLGMEEVRGVLCPGRVVRWTTALARIRRLQYRVGAYRERDRGLRREWSVP